MSKKYESVKLTQKLVKISSKYGNEENIIKFAKDLFEERGVPVKLDVFSDITNSKRYNLEVGNIKKANILFSAHLDTVKADEEKWERNPEKARIENNKLYGLGSVDTKSTTAAAMVSVAKMFKKNENASLILESDEENRFQGAKRFLDKYENKINPDLIVICEPTDLKIVNEQRGLFHSITKIKSNPKYTHASKSQYVKNGSLKTAKNTTGKKFERIYREIMKFRDYLKKKSEDLKDNFTFVLSRIESGSNINSIPKETRIVTDSRIPTGQSTEQTAREFKNRINPLLEEGDEFEIFGSYEPVSVSLDNAAVKKFGQIVSSCGIREEYLSMPAFTELELYTRRLSSPGIVFGTSPMDKAHSPDEYVEVESIKKVQKVFEKVIPRFKAENKNLKLGEED